MDSYSLDQSPAHTDDMIIDQLMTDYGQEILQLVMQYVHNLALAEDLTQEIFLKCYKALPAFQHDASMKTWLWRIAINHSKDYLKSWYARHVEVSGEDGLDCGKGPDGVEQEILQQEQGEELIRAVSALPVMYREVIYFCYYEDRTMKDIAEILQVKEGTVKTRLRRAKQLLQNRLERG
ncbi:sigma-70 family RNA polymerase sigma factor [Sporosarcina trichiuri]|uniref:sigma-70 family RNA polymerase sigma factor n=1 Tax=Sporosarcina trichiuri TaxID=3056445 RepID=UPI0025B28447|nr:sigma-70 family RNA polymerase sigma factor [Sporosarcina sp. 0.2-SM1T-5]WJY26816.1 sigma-70 family RNA polymerase sigma factor [Sporosarcina sp. 0.2-SM1T-5]